MTAVADPSTQKILQAIALTPGDPCGIGPEIIARAWCQAPELTQGCFVAGDVGLMRRAMALLHSTPTFPVVEIDSPEQALEVPARCLPVMQVVPEAPVLPWGTVDARAGQLAGDAVLWATQAALRGEVAALVTAPLHKEALHAAGAPYNQYPGHTELLQAEAARHAGIALDQMPVRMMLANDELRVVLVSVHMSLRDALQAITMPSVLQTLRITDASLSALLGRRPRMAVAGINPHAGEGGLFGRAAREIRLVAEAPLMALDAALIVSATLMGLASDRAEEHAALLRLAAGGFRGAGSADGARASDGHRRDAARHAQSLP